MDHIYINKKIQYDLFFFHLTEEWVKKTLAQRKQEQIQATVQVRHPVSQYWIIQGTRII